MTTTGYAILGLVAWYLALLFLLAGFRLGVSISKRKPANTFAADGSDVPGFGQRLVRAHANCYENLPIFIGVMLLALATGHGVITDPAAMLLLYARIGQSTVHLVSTSVPAVFLRFTLFLVQIAIVVWWLVRLATV